MCRLKHGCTNFVTCQQEEKTKKMFVLNIQSLITQCIRTIFVDCIVDCRGGGGGGESG